MKVSTKKRFLAWVIAFLMVVTYMPSIAYATDELNAGTDVEATAVEPDSEEVISEEAEAVEDEMTEEEISEIAETEETVEAEEPAETKEVETTVEMESVKTNAAASQGEETVTLLNGDISVSNTRKAASLENGVVTIVAEAPIFSDEDPETNYVTIYNETASEAVLKFEYSATNYAKFSETSASGTYKKVLAPNNTEGDSVSLYITPGESGEENAELKLSNFTLDPIAESYEIKVQYDDALGTVSVADETVTTGDMLFVSYDQGTELVASTKSGAEFLGWVNADSRELYSKELTYKLNPTENETIEAVFINEASDAHFLVADKYVVEGFDAAAAKAATTSDKVMALMNDATLPAREAAYEIPADVTMLIPFDDANSLYRDVPEAVHDTSNKPTQPVAYRTLKLASGADLVVNGELSLSAMHYAVGGGGRGGGSPTGDVSFLDMAEGSTVTVNDGAYLYAYGFIVGDGTVTAKDGATVYENFQIEGFRGGTVTTNMVADNEATGNKPDHGILPISQYYVQNIEVPLTLEAGATEYTYTSVYMENTKFGAAVAFISDRAAMFNLSSGNVVKSYDGTTDRLMVEANGNMSLSPITVSLKKNEINSKKFELPINNNITVKINSGEVEINQDLALLPGSEIVIEKGAKCSLVDGTSIYVYDADQWGTYAYSGSGNVQMVPVYYAYSKSYDRTAQPLEDASVLINGTLDASNGFVYTTTTDYETGYGNIYSTDKGVVKLATGSQFTTYQYVQNDSEPYKEIALLTANLKQDSEGNDAYLQPYDEEGTVGTYTYTDGVWLCNHESTENVTKEATCTEAGAKTVSCAEHTYNLVIPAKGHTKVIDDAVKATCTKDGLTEGSHCSVCGETLKAQETIPAPGHTEVIDKGYEVTCTKDGLTDGKHCSVCDEVLVKQEVIPSEGHQWEVVGEAPTCTEDGYGSSKCSVCGEEIDKDTIPALGHNYKWTITTAPTCTEEGVQEGVCQREGCGHETTAPVEATGHSFKDYVDNKDATCTEKGTATAKCENGCGETKDKETEALGHRWNKDDEGNLLFEVDVKPTCTEKGSESVHCTRCDAKDQARDVEALGHTDEEIKAVLPTCTETGLTKGTKCSVCGEITKPQEEVPSLGGHKWDEGTIIDLPTVDIDKDGNVTPVKGKRVFHCENTGCPEKKEEVLEWGKITNYKDFLKNLKVLEDWAFEYAIENNIEDPAALVIRYIRTGVDRYNSGSWQIMAGFDNLKFTDYVSEQEILANDKAKTEDEKVNVTGLKNISNFDLPNGNHVDFGHMFGTIDISYTNKTSINHADVAGFFGDTTDLLTTADRFEVRGTVKEMVADITENYFLKDTNWDDKFGNTDMYGDLDGYYINNELIAEDYEKGMLSGIVEDYFTEDLTSKQRAKYYLENRLQCGSSKAAIRDAVYTAYVGNSVISTLEGTREFKASGDVLSDLRKAACYTVADYICKLAGDFNEDVENNCFTVTSEQFATLAPGITQEIKTATMDLEVQGKPMQYNMQYYIATADITRDDVMVWANYPSRPIKKDTEGNYVWDRMRVEDQANKLQETYSNPENKDLYIENFNVIASTNADGYDMTGDDRGEPGGLLVMNGEEIYPIKANGFFGIKKDGTAVIGTSAEYNEIYRHEIAEAVGGFGSMLVKDGKIVATTRGNLASRTAVGITATGKVVMMVLDGRQQNSPGGDMLDLAHIMYEAGCVDAINLDGGGSSTFVAKQPGDEKISLLNSPSDGYQRSVASSLVAISTAKSSTEFDHAVLKAPTNYMSVGSEMQFTADGVTSTGNPVDVPENATWAVNEEDAKDATISADGKLKALRTGEVTVNLMLDGISVGQKRITIVVPDRVTFTKPTVDVVYDSKVDLPIKAYYQGKAVTINAKDFEFTLSNEAAGKVEGLSFVAGPETTGLKRINVTAEVVAAPSVTATVEIALYKQGENTFDFDQKTGGDKTFAWARTVTNSVTDDNSTYYAVDNKKPMETEYTFAIDMREIPIPEVLEELTDMLPGNDVEGACAWTYLCNLAQRISDSTEVTATVKIDDRFKLVDYKDITVKNEYFKMAEEGIVYDEATNTVTLRLNWVRQYSPIDLEMANPLCLVKGIKLVPKDGIDWGTSQALNVINTGEVSYDVYMRASSLYTFSNDKGNQEKYGLKPFKRTYVDKDGVTQEEAGGGFGSTYVTFQDSYKLVNEEKNGWYVEDGGWKYYVENEPLTGIQKISEMVDGQPQELYYDFGEEGIIKGNTKVTYTGFIANDELIGKKTYSYARYGVLVGGWVKIPNGETTEYYYFDPSTKKSLGAGKHEITVTAQTQGSAIDAPVATITETVEYEFNEKGMVMNGGTWFVNSEGKTYFYYGDGFLCRQWGEKDGKKVYFAMAGHLLQNNIVRIREDSDRPAMYYMFDENCYLVQKCEGFVEWKGSTFYYPTEEQRMSGEFPEDVQDWTAEGNVLKYGRAMGLQKIDGKYYYFKPHKDGEGYGGMLKGERIVEHGIEGACTKLVFDKKNGYAVDKDGNPRTDISHKILVDKGRPATCTQEGLTEGRVCAICDEVLVEQKVIEKTDHEYYKDKVVAPTCGAEGYTLYVCECGDSYKYNFVDATGEHTAVTDKAVAATYFKTGLTKGSHCKVCGKVLTKQKTVAKKKYTAYPKTVKANLSTASKGYDNVRISWSKVSGASGYKVYYKKASAKKWLTLKSVSSKTTSYTTKNLATGTKYTFKVVPYVKSKSGKTVVYSTKYKTASAVTLKKIGTPKVVKSGSKVKVSWKNIAGESGYQISQSTKRSGTKIVANYKTTKGKYKLIKAKKGKKYYYKVRAFKYVKLGSKTYKVYGPWSRVNDYRRR